MENITYYPNQAFFNLEFENVKKDIKDEFRNIEDCGSIIFSKYEGLSLSVNKNGKVKIFSTANNNVIDREVVHKIEVIFQKYNSRFHLLKENSKYIH
ncbi:hypothetical protein [Peribacillus frigoritolerans]|uniref:hypothetical protein n=1 Tax=Peribacillus frigoritolerans TaxID=450367 RepID=UPI003D2A7986